jgi:hypothetical protein
MIKKDLNQPPYFDDFKDSSKYYRILFRPGRAVQARELTQLQTILQNQIEKLGNNLFKNGTQILPGNKQSIKYNNNIGFIKIASNNITSSDDKIIIASNIENILLNKIIKNSSGVEAEIIGYRIASNREQNAEYLSIRLFLNYKTGSVTNQQFFSEGDILTILNDTSTSLQILGQNETDRKTVGFCSSVEITEGVYYYNGNFIYVEKQVLFISPNISDDVDNKDVDNITNEILWNNNPTASIGLKIIESIKTFQDDENLLDNALNSPNQSAPGADRLHIDAILTQSRLSPSDIQAEEDFVKLLDITQGEISYINNTTEFNVIQDTLARRTYDESGDYVVSPFTIQVKDFLRDPELKNNGAHDISEFQFSTSIEAKTFAKNKFNVDITPAVIQYPDGGEVFYPGTSYDGSESTSFKNLCDSLLTLRVDPGKAYVKGYEITKLSRTSVDVPKSRTVKFINNRVISTPLGNYFTVSNLIGIPKFDNIMKINLHNVRRDNEANVNPNSKIGSCIVVGIRNDITSNLYKLYVSDIKLDLGYEIYDVKSFHSDDISGNMILSEMLLDGSISKDQNNSGILTLSGNGTQWKTDIQQLIKKNDYVKLGNIQKYVRVLETPVNNLTLTVDSTSLTSSEIDGLINVTLSLVYSNIQNETNEPGLIFSLPHQYVSTIRTSTETGNISQFSDITYTIERIYTKTTEDKTITLQPISDSESFDRIGSDYKIITNAGKWLTIVQSGTPSADTALVTKTQEGNIVITLDIDGTYTIIAPVLKVGMLNPIGGFERSKNLQETHVVANVQNNKEISLGQCDIFKLVKILASPNAETDPTENNSEDVTHLYQLDDGQRDYFYDVGKVSLRSNSIAPIGRVKVIFQYFEHGDGDYFSVDSYRNSGVSYKQINSFLSSSGILYNLSDCLDFRKKLSLGRAPLQSLKCDYFTYLSRIDNLILSSRTKNFEIKFGIPSEQPVVASDSPDGMTICQLNNLPYGIDSNSCSLTMLPNKRYTMNDIGKLEKRIENLEYYTLLSMLEKETSDMNIVDANGNDRFKNGFLVDNFTSFNSSDVNSPDFLCSLDIQDNNDLRPMVNFENIRLLKATESHVVKTGDLYTLPYTKQTFLKQAHATKLINVNPFNVSTYIGEIELSPWSDEWWENKLIELPTIIDDSNINAARSLYGNKEYNEDFTNVIDVDLSKKQRTGKQKLLTAGHEFLDNIKNQTRRKKILADGFIKVPEGYINEGELVPIGSVTQLQNQKSQTLTVTSQTIRTGFQHSVQEIGTTTSKTIENVEISNAKYIRSREIKFKGSLFKPKQKLYAFFDDINVTQFCRPNNLGVDLVDAKDVTVALVDQKTSIRKFELNNSNSNLKIGAEVIHQLNSSIRRFDIVDIQQVNNKTYIYCLEKNEIGNKILGDVLNSGNTIQLSITKNIYGDEIITDESGNISGTFKIPDPNNNELGIRFKTGDIKFILTSSSTNSILTKEGSLETSGNINYSAKGFIKTDTIKTTQTRDFAIITTPFTEVGSTSSETSSIFSLGQVVERDPIAQTFRVDEKGGCFITDIDIFFASKSTTLPVILELRTVSDDFSPSMQLVSGKLGRVIKNCKDVVVNQVLYESTSKILKIIADVDGNVGSSELINGKHKWTSNSSVTNDIKSQIISEESISNIDNMASLMIPTRFTFSSPIYLEEGKTYSLVLLSDSNEYTTWIAQTGKIKENDENILKYKYYNNVDNINTKIGSDNTFSDNIYLNGNFYKSNNGKGWSIDNTISMKFNLLKANFNINSIGMLTLENENILPKTLSKNSIEIKKSGSDVYLKVRVINHGASKNDRVTFHINENSTANLNGINKSTLTNPLGLLVTKTLIDHIIIKITNPTEFHNITNGIIGDNSISLLINNRFEEAVILANTFIPDNSELKFNIESISSKGVNEITERSSSKILTYNVNYNIPIVFNSPMKISSSVNEQKDIDGNNIKSLNIVGVFSSNNSNLSPVLDYSRLSVALKSHRLNDPRSIGDNIEDLITFNDFESESNTILINEDSENSITIYKSSNGLTGTFTQEIGSNIIEADNINDFDMSEINIGDNIWYNNQSRIIVKIFDTGFQIDSAFNPNPTSALLQNDKQSTKITTTNSIIANQLSELTIGKLLSCKLDNDSLFSDKLILDVKYTPTEVIKATIIIDYNNTNNDITFNPDDSNLELMVKNTFVDEIAPEGSSSACKYVSKKLVLDRPCSALKVSFDAIRDLSCDIKLYIRTELVGDSNSLYSNPWKMANFNILSDGTFILKTPEADTSRFKSYESTINNMKAFLGVQIKLVMTGGNTAKTPRIKNLKIIALDE